MRRNLDIATLRSFAAVIETGGVTRAASRLNLTQSAVSMQIKRLEESLDQALLDRNGRGVNPTQEGEHLFAYAKKMIRLNDETVDQMVSPRFEGEVAFGVPCDVIYPHAPKMLSRFDSDYPRVRVKFVSSYSTQLLEEFRAGKLDVVLTTESSPGPDSETLASKALLWCGAPGGRAWTQDPLPYASARHCCFRPAAIKALEDAGIQWRSGVDTDTDLGAVAVTTADLGVMTLLDGTYDDRLLPVPHSGKLPPLPEFSINLYVANGTANDDLAKEFARYIRDAYAS